MSIRIMSQVFEIEGLGPTHRLILLALADHADDQGRCYPSIARLCQRTGLKERAVQSNLRDLQTTGYVKVKANAGPNGCNVYFVRASPAGNAPPQEMHPASNAPDPRRKCTQTVREPSLGKETDVSYPSRAFALRAADDRFEEFWHAYPHRRGAKKGKADAQKRWAAAIKAQTDPQEIIDGAIRFRRDRQAIEGYAPDPATWLNKKRWTDDVEPPAPLTPIEGGRRHDDNNQPARASRDPHARALGGLVESWGRVIAAQSGGRGSDGDGD